MNSRGILIKISPFDSKQVLTRINKQTLSIFLIFCFSLFTSFSTFGQPIADGQDKFLGNIIGNGLNIPSDFSNYWNQVTAENAGKWQNVERNQDEYYWTQLDSIYNYAIEHNFPYKHHTLIWGNQQPRWINELDSAEQYKQIVEWISLIGQRYPKADFCDVVNEPLPDHNPPDGGGSRPRANYKNALGGDGVTGWDWVINSFKLARKYLPNTKLLINDYGILNSTENTNAYIKLINILKDSSLIDGIGCQAHGFEETSAVLIKSNLDKLAQTGLPIYITELDINIQDDEQQKVKYEELFPLMWEHPAVKGITLWGYIQNRTWKPFTYLLTNKLVERPAMKWLRSYLLSSSKTSGSYYTGNYPNLFAELLNKSDDEINTKIDSAFSQLFYGDDKTERLYYPVEPDMAYIEDINNTDVRTEGMSYGMMIAVQMNKKKEFDRLWKWAKTYMQHQDGPSKYYFAWHCKTNGEVLSYGSASDGEEWFVISLLFASARWGDDEGIFNYKVEAQNILDAMLNKNESSDGRNVVTNMFNKKEKKVVFVPDGSADDFTDPSYHLPHYYELWARWADKNNQFWYDAADTSREYFKRAVNPETGLAPDYTKFDGSPYNPFGGGNNNFQFDAWRTIANVAIDYTWFAKDDWEVEECNKLLNFFYSKGVKTYGNNFTLDGKQYSNAHSTGLVAMNTVACLASTSDNTKDFVEDLWNAEVPTGKYRYYDGMLYMLGMLQVTGNFRIYDLKETAK